MQFALEPQNMGQMYISILYMISYTNLLRTRYLRYFKFEYEWLLIKSC